MRFQQILPGAPLEVVISTHDPFVGCEACARSILRFLEYGVLDMRHESRNDGLRNFVLERKQVLYFPVKAFAPQQLAGQRVGQFHRHTHPRRLLANRALYQVAHPQSITDLHRVDGFIAEPER